MAHAAHKIQDWNAPRLGARAVGWDDAKWWNKSFYGVPADLIKAAENLYVQIYAKTQSNVAANTAVRKVREAIGSARGRGIPLDATDDDIISCADRAAHKCYRYPGQEEKIAKDYGIDPPSPMSRARLIDPTWWRRQLRRAVGRDSEAAARRIGIVQRRKGCYASDRAVSRRDAQNKRNRRILESLDAVSGDEVLGLDAVVDASLANPKLRRTELITRIAGAEEYADAHGDVGIFVTMTCPPRFHAYHESGERCADFNGATPREGQDYLCRIWNRVRAAAQRLDLRYYGLRVAEPHHDGTPHWHMVIFCAPEHVEVLRDIMLRHFVELDFSKWPDTGYEPGTREHGLEIRPIDKTKGRASSYIAKYIAKNIDGEGLAEDESGLPGDQAARRANAWSATWGIRQFQAFGMPEVGVWRELRRIDGAPAGPIGDCWKAAHNGKWADYMSAQERRPVSLAVAWSDKPNRYGEPRGNIVVGVESSIVVGVESKRLRVPTRLKEWTIRKRSLRDLGELSITVRHNQLCVLNTRATSDSVAWRYADHSAAQNKVSIGQRGGKSQMRGPPGEESEAAPA